jgi:pimeloyl-ACP methyl ester carboxylesterase
VFAGVVRRRLVFTDVQPQPAAPRNAVLHCPPMAPLAGRIVSFEDVDLYVEEAGSGRPLVFIHDYTLDHELWHEQVTVCAPSFRCVTYDLRGHGASSSPDGGYALSDHLGDLWRTLDELGIDAAAIVGLSMGGGIALAAALARPERVRRLVLASSVLNGLPWEPAMWNWFRDFETQARQVWVQVAIDRVWMPGPLFQSVRRYPALARRVRDMAARFSGGNIFDRTTYPRPQVTDRERLSEVRCPTLVLRGEFDRPEFVRRAEMLAGGIPGARLELIPRAGHFVNLEAPSAFNRALQKFLKEE